MDAECFPSSGCTTTVLVLPSISTLMFLLANLELLVKLPRNDRPAEEVIARVLTANMRCVKSIKTLIFMQLSNEKGHCNDDDR